MKLSVWTVVAVAMLQGPMIHASFDNKKGARPLGMGGAFVAQADDADAGYYNVAGWWRLTTPQLRGFYSVPFNLTELNTLACTAVYPFSRGSAAVVIESFGFDLYRETSAGAGFAGAFRERIAWGAAVYYHHLRIKDGGSAATLGSEFGLLVRPHASLHVGATGRNLHRPKLAGETLPQSLAAGVSWQPVRDLTVNADIYRDLRFDADLRFGVEYRIHPRWQIRTGIGSEPSRFSAGTGIDFEQGAVDYAFYTHPDLGITHAVSLSVLLGRKPHRELKPGRAR
jgi:hypothetical protein